MPYSMHESPQARKRAQLRGVSSLYVPTIWHYACEYAMKTPSQNGRLVSLSVRVPENLRKEIRMFALQRDLTIADLIAKAFAALKAQEKGQK